jgi:uncharacterized protein (DUF1800 family)
MPTSLEDTAHLLSRCGYLTTPTLVADKAQMDLPELVNWVLDETPNGAATLNYTTSTSWERYNELRQWWVMRMASVPQPLHEKLTMFFHGLFASSHWKVNDYVLMQNQNTTIRNNAFGDFEVLAQAVAIDPAMLLYLDNAWSTKWGPNENWAREMMELFLMGVDNGYSQTDVVEVAKAWTGYSLQWTENQPYTYLYRPDWHDNSVKSIFPPLAPRNWSGPEVITEILKGSKQTNSSEYVAGRIWGHFAKPKPDLGMRQSLGANLRGVGWNIKEFLRVMFQRPEFYNPDVKAGMIHQPVDWAALLLRATGLGSEMPDYMDQRLADLGQGVFEPPTVAGWKYNTAWLNENAVWMKDEVASSVARDATTAPKTFLADIVSQPVPAAIQTALNEFGITQVSPQTLTALESYLTAERAANSSNQRYGLIRMIALSPEFQMA